MHKRKVAGILQYGNRLSYNKIIKLQEGGHVGVAEAYNWREDPYELMLLQQKAAKDNAKLRYSAKTAKKDATPPKPVKSILGDFDEIKGGLKGSRESAQAEAKSLVDDFYAAVEKNGREWLYTDSASRAFSQIQTRISNLTEEVKNEKDEFDKLRGNISEDSLSAKAISTSGHAFVRTKGADGKVTEAIIPMEKYYESPDSYAIGTLSDLIEWKSTRDGSRNLKVASMFLGDNALGDNDLRDTYIKDRGEVQFKIDKGMVIATENHSSVDAGQEVGSVDQVLSSVKSVLNGKEIKNDKMGTEELSLLKEVIKDVTKTVYSSEIASNTRLRSSLLSQAVSDPRVQARLRELPKDERAQYMEDAISAIWIEKIVSKNYPGKPGSESNGGSPKITAETDLAGNAYASFFDSAHKEQFTQGAIVDIADGGTSKVYDYDTSDEDNVYRMTSVKFPAKTNVFEPKVYVNKDAKEEEVAQNFAFNNPDIKYNLNVRKSYTMDGTPLSAVMIGQTADDFLTTSAMIEPGSAVDFVALPVDSSGNPVHAATAWVNDLKMQSREAFIAAYKNATGNKAPFKAADIVSGSTNPDKQTFYNMYTKWVNDGLNVAAAKAFYLSESKKGGQAAVDAKIAYTMAQAAEKLIAKTKTVADANKGRYGGLQMKVFGIYTVNYDDSWTNGGVSDNIVKTAKQNKFGAGGIKDATNEFGKNNIRRNDNADRSIFSTDIKSLRLLAPVKDMAERSASKGDENWTNRAEVENIERKLLTGLNTLSALSHPTAKNVAHLLL